MRQRYLFENDDQNEGIAFEGNTHTGRARIYATVEGDTFYVTWMTPENLRKLAAGIAELANMLDPPKLPLATLLDKAFVRSQIAPCGTTGF